MVDTESQVVDMLRDWNHETIFENLRLQLVHGLSIIESLSLSCE